MHVVRVSLKRNPPQIKLTFHQIRHGNFFGYINDSETTATIDLTMLIKFTLIVCLWVGKQSFPT